MVSRNHGCEVGVVACLLTTILVDDLGGGWGFGGLCVRDRAQTGEGRREERGGRVRFCSYRTWIKSLL